MLVCGRNTGHDWKRFAPGDWKERKKMLQGNSGHKS